jgi:hypothetical protein
MKSKVYDAVKMFEQRIQAAFPGATLRLTDAFGGHDIGVELLLPVAHIAREERMKIAELAAEIEDECDVYLGTMAKPQA